MVYFKDSYIQSIEILLYNFNLICDPTNIDEIDEYSIFIS